MDEDEDDQPGYQSVIQGLKIGTSVNQLYEAFLIFAESW